MLRRVIVAGLSTCVLGLTFGFSQTANALPQNPNGNDCWIDAATGKPVTLIPAGTPHGEQPIAVSDGRVFLPGTGVTAVRDLNGNWINAQTGEPVSTIPAGTPHGEQPIAVSDGRIYLPGTKVTAVRVPCPPTDASTTPQMQSGVTPGGVLQPGKDEAGHDTSDKPVVPLKDDKAQQADVPKNQQTDKAVTEKDKTPPKSIEKTSKATTTKHLTGPKSAQKTASKSKEKKKQEDKTEVHIEFFSTRSGGGGFGTGGFGR